MKLSSLIKVDVVKDKNAVILGFTLAVIGISLIRNNIQSPVSKFILKSMDTVFFFSDSFRDKIKGMLL